MTALVLLAGLAPAAPIPHAVTARRARLDNEVAALRGRWKLVQYAHGPRAYDGDATFETEAHFHGTVVTFRRRGAVIEHSLAVIDPDAEPKRIELTELVGLPAAGHQHQPLDPDRPPRRRVYRIVGDNMVITARADARSEYPARVITSPEPGLEYYLYQRIREVAPPPRPAR